MKDSVVRFTPSERWLHNVVMFTFSSLFLTGMGMVYFNLMGDQGAARKLLVSAHQYVSVVFMAAPLLFVTLGNRRVWKENFHLLTTWGWKDLEWLVKKPLSAVFGNIHLPPTDKFNPGQKTWATLAVTGSKTLAVTGLIMWNVPSPILAIMIHTAVGMGLGLAIVGHVFMAVGNKDTRPSFNSIVNGKVSAKWATHHHPLWMERETQRRVRDRPEFVTAQNHVEYAGKS